MTHRYDPQDRPIYPALSYREQIADWIEANLSAIGAVMCMLIGAMVMWLLLEWVY